MKIAEVAKRFDLTADTLRYYEKIGLIAPVPKNSSGIREYTEKELVRVRFIKCMRTAGLSIESIRQYIALDGNDSESILARKEVLLKQKEVLDGKIHDLQEMADYLQSKIERYDDALGEFTKKEVS